MKSVDGSLKEQSWELFRDDSGRLEGLVMPTLAEMEDIARSWRSALGKGGDTSVDTKRIWVSQRDRAAGAEVVGIEPFVAADVSDYAVGILRFGRGVVDSSRSLGRVVAGTFQKYEPLCPSEEVDAVIARMTDVCDASTMQLLDRLGSKLTPIEVRSSIIRYPAGLPLDEHTDPLRDPRAVILSHNPHSSESTIRWKVGKEQFLQEPGDTVALGAHRKRIDGGYITALHMLAADSSVVNLQVTVYDGAKASGLVNTLTASSEELAYSR